MIMHICTDVAGKSIKILLTTDDYPGKPCTVKTMCLLTTNHHHHHHHQRFAAALLNWSSYVSYH